MYPSDVIGTERNVLDRAHVDDHGAMNLHEHARIEFFCGVVLHLQPEDIFEVKQPWRTDVAAEAGDGE